MAEMRKGNLLWKNNVEPISETNPVHAKDVNSDDNLAKLEQVRLLLSGIATEAKLEQARALLNTIAGKDFATDTELKALKTELGLVKAELQAVKTAMTDGTQKVQQVGTNVSDNESMPTREASVFDYKQLEYRVTAFRGDTVYGRDNTATNLYKSTDNGDTFGQAIWTIPDGFIRYGHLTANGVLLIFSSDDKVYRSTDDVNFTMVLDNARAPVSQNAVDSNGDVICFGEYYVPSIAGTDFHLWRSADGGVTWAPVITLTREVVPMEVHFHSLQYMRQHDRWIATTGDGLIKWFVSNDSSASSFSIAVEADGVLGQIHRTLGITAIGRDKLMWGTDGSSGVQGIYQADVGYRMSKVARPQKLITLTKPCYGVGGLAPYFLTGTYSSSPGYVGAELYVSQDSGRTFMIDKRFATAGNGGIREVFGPDAKGNYYIAITNAVGYPENISMRLTPNIQQRKDIIPSSPQVISPAGSAAQGYQSLQVANLSVGFSYTNYSHLRHAVITCENAAVRFRIDGEPPTATEGHLLNPGDTLTLDSNTDISQFRAIQAGASSGTLKATFSGVA